MLDMSDVTRILSRIESGDRQASEQLLPLVYQELRKLAGARMARERPDHTLQATALVHEAYARLVGSTQRLHWDSRRHFFTAASEAMRRILVERARKKNRRMEIQGPRVPLEDLTSAVSFPEDRLLMLDDALAKLESQNSEAASVVQLRFFAGLTVEQAAKTLGISLRTAERHWTYARTWLHRELE